MKMFVSSGGQCIDFYELMMNSTLVFEQKSRFQGLWSSHFQAGFLIYD